MHINKINGKAYIGITNNSLQQRWKNGKGYKTGKFRQAINKYGWDSFAHIVLDDGLILETAMSLEVQYIERLRTRERKFGYNIHVGGNIRKGYQHTEETKRLIAKCSKNISQKTREKMKVARAKQIITDEHKKHMSESMTGKKFSDEHLKNLSLSHIGNPGFWTGKKRDKETGQKIAEKLSKKVICITTGDMFDSISDASRKTGKPICSISKWCRGTNGKDGMTWAYQYC